MLRFIVNVDACSVLVPRTSRDGNRKSHLAVPGSCSKGSFFVGGTLSEVIEDFFWRDAAE